jgi:HlyD family secretion protein
VEEADAVLKVPMAALRFTPSDEHLKAAPAANGGRADRLIALAQGDGRPATVWRGGADGSLEPMAIGVGVDDGAYAAIVSGELAEGDQVVVGEIVEAAPARLFGIRFGF